MKNKKRLLLSLCCALMLSTASMGLAACGDDGDSSSLSSDSTSSSDVLETFDGGEYYAGGTGEAASGANTLSISSDGNVTLKIGAQTLTGTYTYKNNSFTMTFSDSSTATAIVSDGTIMLAYDGQTYTFLEKVEYTVSFNVEGTVASTKKVVNGRFMTKPEDPEKSGFVFAGWYTDAQFTKSFVFDSTAIVSDLTLYARFVEPAAEEYTVTLIVDGATWKAITTVGGIATELGVPEKAGFIGWWVGDKEGNVSAEYKGEALKENTVLIAVFESEAPIVSVTATQISWTAKGVNNSYVVTIKNSEGEEVDSTSTGNASYAFDFAAQPAGEYTIEVSLNGKVGTAKYKNKFLAQVSNFQVVGNSLVFNSVENATKYLITCECGTATHVHTDQDNGNSTVYDFSLCDMKADGIKFTVKAVASGWMTSQSEEYVVIRNLDATTVTVDKATETASWTAVANAESYDVSINGTVVATNVTGTSFDLKGYAPATLAIKVTAKAHGYNSSNAEISYQKKSLISPANIALDGSKLTWNAVTGASAYTIKVGDKVLPNVTKNEYTLTNADLPAGATSCTVQIMAVGATADANSLYSNPITVNFGAMSDNVQYANGLVTWDPVLGAKGYEVQVNGGQIVPVTANSYALAFENVGAHVIKVRCVKADDSTSGWVDTYVTAYKTTFDVSGGNAVAAVYAAEGDTVQLPTATKNGYNLLGWFNTPNGTNGVEYETFVQGAEDATVYAHWSARTFIVKLNAGNAVLEETEIEVTFDQAYKLPIPELAGSNFGGWYTQANGKGYEYANENGDSIGVWRDLQEVTLIANWIEVLRFEEYTDEENGDVGYIVYGGADVKTVSKIRIPETYKGKAVIAIGGSAFESCGSLRRLEIPDTIQEIVTGSGSACLGAGSAFRYCYNLTEFEVYETEGGHTRHYETIDGQLVWNNPNRGKELVFVSTTLGNTQDTYEIPEGVEVIPESLFAGTTFKTVIIPSSVKEIAASAFSSGFEEEYKSTSSAYKLEKIEFTDSKAPLTEDNGLIIREFAFAGAYKLASIELPARLLALPTEMGHDETLPVTFASIFKSCSILEKVHIANPTTADACYYMSNDGMVCTAADKQLVYCPENRTGTIAIPSTVASIGEMAFYQCKKIVGVSIHGFVSSIGKSAFEECTGLTSVTFTGRESDDPMDIATRAFYKCTGLTSIELPANLGTLSEYAFGATSALTDVTVNVGANAILKEKAFGTEPSTTTSPSLFYVTTVVIGENVPIFPVAGVFGAERLANLDASKAKNYYSDEYGVLYNRVEAEVEGETVNVPTEVLFCPMTLSAEYKMPKTITTIGAGVFNGKLFTSIEIAENVTSIGDNAFANCKYLEKVTFVNADAAITETNGLSIGASAFEACERLATVTLPVRLKTVGTAAFKGCKTFAGKVTLPANVTSVGAGAFLNCAAITEVEALGAKTDFATNSENFYVQNKNTAHEFMGLFEGCSSLTKITVAESNEKFMTKDGVLYKKSGGVATELVYCPIKCAGKEETEDGVKLNVIRVPNTVTKVWTYAFELANGVDKVVFESNTENPVDLSIGARAFYMASTTGGSSRLQTVVLPNGIKKIGMNAFEQSSIKTINIPKTVTDIEIDAFLKSGALSKVDFEENRTVDLNLGRTSTVSKCYGPFGYCTSLTNVRLPEKTAYIGCSAFSYSGLKTIYIPSTVTNVYNTAFQFSELETIDFAPNSQLTTIAAGAFRDNNLSQIDLPEKVNSIASNAFSGTLLTSFEIPKGITSLADIFGKHTTLQRVTFATDTQLTTIEKNAFLGCSALTSISIPSSVTTIGFTAFKECYNLSSVTFEADKTTGKISLQSIDHDAFNSTALTQFILPETTAQSLTLNYAMFKGCKNLTTVSLPSQLASLSRVFEGCQPVANLTVSENNENIEVKDGIIYNKIKQEDGSYINTQIVYVMKDINTAILTIPEGITDIAQSAFSNQPSLKEVIIPSSIKTIGASAFANCYNLQKVTFAKSDDYAETLAAFNTSLFQNCRALKDLIGVPSTVASMGDSVFENCTSLTSFTIPANVSTIGKKVFKGTAITSITIPAKVKVLNNETFMNCTKLQTVNFDKNAEGAYGITTLNADLFYGCTSLSTFIMPDTVTSTYDLFGFSGIKNVTLSANLTTLYDYMFDGCTELESIVIPDKITKISNYAFRGCTSLGKYNETTQTYGKVQLPASLKEMGKNVFENCTSLTEISFPDSMVELDEGSSWSSSRSSYAFLNCTALKTVNLNNLTKIGKYAFQGCTSLQNIDLSKVTDMNGYVFDGCTSLKRIDLSALTNTSSGYDFQNCINLDTVTLGSSLSKIGSYMFAGCEKLASIEIPESVETIASGAFKNCVLLKEITIPAKVTALNASTFSGCINLEKVEIKGKLTALGTELFLNCAKITEFTVPNSMTGLGNGAPGFGDRVFAGTSIKSITIPKGYIKDWSNTTAPFDGCNTLEQILVAEGNGRFESRDGILYDLDGNIRAVPAGKVFANDTFVIPEGAGIGKQAFAGVNVKKVVLPESMTSVPMYAFSRSKVETVVLGSQVTLIDEYAFQKSTGIKNILKKDADGVEQASLEGIVEIKRYAFSGATAFTSITLPTTLTTLGANTFSESGLTSITYTSDEIFSKAAQVSKCVNLTEVILAEGITTIYQAAFDGCTSLTSITLPSTLTSIGKSAFKGTGLTSISIPGNVAIGESAFQNCASLASVTLGEGLTTLPEYAFDGCTALTQITLPESLTTLESYVFQNTGLTTITVPASVTSIPSYAFNGCTALTSITLKEGLTAIANNTFVGTKLTNVTIPSTVTSIGSYAFSGVSTLTNINVPAAVTSIGAFAFEGCTALTSITIPVNAYLTGDGVFAGWTETQQINVCTSARIAAVMWSAGWLGGDAKVTFNYVAQA